MRRHLLGLFALVLIVAGVMSYLGSGDSASGATFAGSAVRIGVVLAALWLAWPDVMQWNPWLTAAMLLGVAMVVMNFKSIVVVGPVLLAIWLLWKRQKRGGPPRDVRSETSPPKPNVPTA